MLLLFFGLIYFSFQVTAVAKDRFGRLLSAGITVYLAMHVIVNIGMVSGMLPTVGIPLPLFSYGLSNLWITLASLGCLNNIAIRRFYY